MSDEEQEARDFANIVFGKIISELTLMPKTKGGISTAIDDKVVAQLARVYLTIQRDFLAERRNLGHQAWRYFWRKKFHIHD